MLDYDLDQIITMGKYQGLTLDKALDKMEKEALDGKQVSDYQLLEIFVQERGYDPYSVYENSITEPSVPTNTITLVKGTGRHPKKYSFTRYDVAKAIGRSIHTVRRDILLKKLDMNDLVSISRYIISYLSRYTANDTTQL